MKSTTIKFILLTAIIGTTFLSCKKNGTGGEATIAVFVKHHSNFIPGATVYLKYGAKEFPGTDLGKYDVNKVCGVTGHSTGHTHFEELLKGNYYLYAVGYDSTTSQTVTGGLHIKIKEHHEHIEADIPVTE